MAPNYKIEIQATIMESAEATLVAAHKTGVGAFESVISAEQARNIDTCEQHLLQSTYSALRDALAQHLSSVSEHYAQEVVGSVAECEIKAYRVDGEVGRIIFDTYWCATEAGTVASPFPMLHAQEWYRTVGFKELGLVYGSVEKSYRKATDLVNRVRHQAGATPSRTLRDNTAYEGQQIAAYMEHQATALLHQYDFTADGVPTDSGGDYAQRTLLTLPPAQVAQAIHTCAPAPEWVAEMTDNPVPYEDPVHSTNVSLDDVNVKRQKDTRPGTQETPAKRKYAHNTIAHIAHAGAVYIISGQGVAQVLRLVLAFLLHNQLLQYNLIFLLDGQRTLYTTVLRVFSWFPPIQLILDWYHLEKRCKQQLSLALHGRVLRNAVLAQLLPCLWQGSVDRALKVLQAVAPTTIKNQEAFTKMTEYLERNRPYIPCYAARKHLGLCNSSNRGEKANDLVVSARQKHNGMSWSRCGSAALAAVTALVRNQEYKRWFQSHTLSFSFCT